MCFVGRILSNPTFPIQPQVIRRLVLMVIADCGFVHIGCRVIDMEDESLPKTISKIISNEHHNYTKCVKNRMKSHARDEIPSRFV